MNRRFLLLSALPTFGLLACGQDQPTFDKPESARGAYSLVATQGHGFLVGSPMAVNTVHVLFDAQCPHCATLWTQSQPLLNRIKMKWLPVAILRGSSVAQGATILAAKDPVAAMNEHESLLLQRRGGISAGSVTDADERKITVNTAIFKALGAESVPFLVFKNAKTSESGTYAGAMGTEQLAALLGL